MVKKAEPVWTYKAVLEGFILQGVVWRLPQASDHFPHGYKYRLFLGRAEDGTCLLRYDNERGKGDHRHLPDGTELPLDFSGPQALIDAFLQEAREVMYADLQSRDSIPRDDL